MLVDSWAWIELFAESPHSARIRRLIAEESAYASSLAIAEVADWCVRNGREPTLYLKAMHETATIVEVSAEIAGKAGRSLSLLRRQSPRIGMVDAVMYATAASAGTLLLTGDEHFKNLPGVEFLG